VAIIVGAALGFVVGRATKSPPTAGNAPVAQVQPQKPERPQPPSGGEDPNAIYRVPVGDSAVDGPADAKVTIIEATDFQCPYCVRANATLRQIKEAYPRDVRVAVKQNPLSFHQYAHMAAEAALAAQEQGKYWPMHEKLFASQQASDRGQQGLDRASLERYAQELGLDMARFKSALDTQKFKGRIEAEQKLVSGLGAGGTPSFFINGRKVVGAQPFERFKQIVDEEIAKADALIARGGRADGIYEEIVKNAATSPVMLPANPSVR
jgi:protein-disulfide isomerase